MPVEDDYTNGDFAVLRTTIDSFGVPSNLTGNHPEEFFSMLGRIVALSALLENRVLVFYQYLVGRRQDEHTELGVGTLIANALGEIQRLPEPADRQLAEQFLMEAKAITGRRNDYVHNLWPAQSDGRLFGWRVPQKKNAQEVLTTTSTLDEMRDDLRSLVALLEVSYINRVLGLVSGGDHLQGSAVES